MDAPGMQLQFDASQFDPAMGNQPWTDGWHPVVITTSGGKPTAKGGGMLSFNLTAIDGPMKGLNHFLGLNLWNSNETAVRIANQELSALVYVTLGVNQGRLNFGNTAEMHNIPFMVLAARQKDNPARSEIIAYKDIRGGDPKTGQGAQGGGAPTPTFTAPAPAQPAFQPPPQTAPAWNPAGAQQPAPVAAAPAPAWQPPQQQQQQPAPAAAWQPPAAQQPAPAATAWQPPGTGPSPAAPAPAWVPPTR